MTIAKNGDFDVYVSSTTTAPTGDPEYFFTSTVTGAKNYGNYQNEEVTKLTDQLHQTFDKDERAKLAVELQQDILDDDAFFFVRAMLPEFLYCLFKIDKRLFHTVTSPAACVQSRTTFPHWPLFITANPFS